MLFHALVKFDVVVVVVVDDRFYTVLFSAIGQAHYAHVAFDSQ